MSEAIGQPGQAALLRPLGIGDILGTAFGSTSATGGPYWPSPPWWSSP
jgi:hypothetical protein